MDFVYREMSKRLYKKNTEGGRSWAEALHKEHDVFGGVSMLQYSKKTSWKSVYGTLRRIFN